MSGPKSIQQSSGVQCNQGGSPDRLTLFRISKQVELAMCSHRCVSPASRLPLLSPLLGSAIDTSSIGHRSSLRSIDYRIGHRSSIAVSTDFPGTHGTTGTIMHATGITMEYDIMEIGTLVLAIPLITIPLDYHSLRRRSSRWYIHGRVQAFLNARTATYC